MKENKGMSQILVLIVAAAVLMMVGLLLISLSSGSITDTFSNTKSAACTSQLDSQCATSGGDVIAETDYPASCFDDSGNRVSGVPAEYSCN